MQDAFALMTTHIGPFAIIHCPPGCAHRAADIFGTTFGNAT